MADVNLKRFCPDSPDPNQARKKRLVHLESTELDSDICFLPTPATGTPTSSTPPAPTSSVSTPIPLLSPSLGLVAKKTCPQCGKVFRRAGGVRKHMKVHITQRSFSCSYERCNKKFRTGQDLEDHISYMHLDQRHFPCDVNGCQAAFDTKTRLRRHQNCVHKGGLRCSRIECDRRFRNKDSLDRHLREHDGLLPFVCNEPRCGASFKAHSTLWRHKQDHKQIDYWCSECDLKFKDASTLLNHRKKNHVPCSFCAEIFCSQEEMETHVNAEHGDHSQQISSMEERRTFQCPDCPKAFTRVSNLNAHWRTAHQGFRFCCGTSDMGHYQLIDGWTQENGCGKTFTTKIKLVEHIRFNHLSQPRQPQPRQKADIIEELSRGTPRTMAAVYECREPECTLRFKRITDLERHQKFHLETSSCLYNLHTEQQQLRATEAHEPNIAVSTNQGRYNMPSHQIEAPMGAIQVTPEFPNELQIKKTCSAIPVQPLGNLFLEGESLSYYLPTNTRGDLQAPSPDPESKPPVVDHTKITDDISSTSIFVSGSEIPGQNYLGSLMGDYMPIDPNLFTGQDSAL